MATDPEADLIRRLFRRSAFSAAALDFTDDGALLSVAANVDQALTKDALVEGVHFLPDDPPDTVAWKAVAVNLSDLAAMGAEPTGILSAIAVPRDRDGAWLSGFADGMHQICSAFSVPLLGGDITRTPGPVTLSVTALGCVATGAALRRNGGKSGHVIAVSGTIGDAALGLRVRLGELADTDGFLIDRYRRPQPRVPIGTALAGTGAAGMDVSDGLYGDLSRLCRESGVGAEIDVARIPLSAQAAEILAEQPQLFETVVTGGDDYELLITGPETVLSDFFQRGDLTPIGRLTGRTDEILFRQADGTRWQPSGAPGYSHL